MFAMRILIFLRPRHAVTICSQNSVKTQMNNTRLVRMHGLSIWLESGKSTLYDKGNPKSKYFDPDFPRPIALSNSPRGAKAWRVSDIEAWLQLRAEKSGTTNASVPPIEATEKRDKYEIPAQSKTIGIPGLRKKTTLNTETSNASANSPPI